MRTKLPGPFLKVTERFGVHTSPPTLFFPLFFVWWSAGMLQSLECDTDSFCWSCENPDHQPPLWVIHCPGTCIMLALSSKAESGLKTDTGYRWVCRWGEATETSIAFHCSMFLPRTSCLMTAVGNHQDGSVQRGYLCVVPHKSNKCDSC